MKKGKIFLFCICIVVVLSCTFIIFTKSRSNSKNSSNSYNKKEITHKMKNNQIKEDNKKENESLKEKNITNDEKSDKVENTKTSDEVSKKLTNDSEKKTDTKTIHNSSTNKNNNSVQSNSSNNNASNSKSERPMTAWEKLGISEEQYNNSPGPNEGEIAFRKPESVCESTANSITNMYAFVTHVGDVKSYSDKYIGCWITIHLPSGEWMFYGKFKEREKRGEFKDALIS